MMSDDNATPDPGYDVGKDYEYHMGVFREDVEDVINRCCMENGSDTPDFILAEYLIACLRAFDAAVSRREQWYGSPRSD